MVKHISNVKKEDEVMEGALVKDTDLEGAVRKDKNKYILVVPNPFGADFRTTRRVIEYPIDKPEPKILDEIRSYLKKNNFHNYELYRGRRVDL